MLTNVTYFIMSVTDIYRYVISAPPSLFYMKIEGDAGFDFAAKEVERALSVESA